MEHSAFEAHLSGLDLACWRKYVKAPAEQFDNELAAARKVRDKAVAALAEVQKTEDAVRAEAERKCRDEYATDLKEYQERRAEWERAHGPSPLPADPPFPREAIFAEDDYYPPEHPRILYFIGTDVEWHIGRATHSAWHEVSSKPHQKAADADWAIKTVEDRHKRFAALKHRFELCFKTIPSVPAIFKEEGYKDRGFRFPYSDKGVLHVRPAKSLPKSAARYPPEFWVGTLADKVKLTINTADRTVVFHDSYELASIDAQRFLGELVESADDAAELLARWGKFTGVCMSCGNPLTDAASLERGVGPDCYSRTLKRKRV
jgi:hypothetical protein